MDYTATLDAGLIVLQGQLYTRPGYTQTGWAVIDGGAKMYELGQQINLNRNMVLYPAWTTSTQPLKLTVTYSAHGSVTLSGTNVSMSTGRFS